MYPRVAQGNNTFPCKLNLNKSIYAAAQYLYASFVRCTVNNDTIVHQPICCNHVFPCELNVYIKLN